MNFYGFKTAGYASSIYVVNLAGHNASSTAFNPGRLIATQ